MPLLKGRRRDDDDTHLFLCCLNAHSPNPRPYLSHCLLLFHPQQIQMAKAESPVKPKVAKAKKTKSTKVSTKPPFVEGTHPRTGGLPTNPQTSWSLTHNPPSVSVTPD
jgi:hypothetical protein